MDSIKFSNTTFELNEELVIADIEGRKRIIAVDNEQEDPPQNTYCRCKGCDLDGNLYDLMYDVEFYNPNSLKRHCNYYLNMQKLERVHKNPSLIKQFGISKHDHIDYETAKKFENFLNERIEKNEEDMNM